MSTGACAESAKALMSCMRSAVSTLLRVGEEDLLLNNAMCSLHRQENTNQLSITTWLGSGRHSTRSPLPFHCRILNRLSMPPLLRMIDVYVAV